MPPIPPYVSTVPTPGSLKRYSNMPINRGCLIPFSEEGDKCEVLLPLMEGNTWEVVGLTCDDRGIPNDLKTKVEITESWSKKLPNMGAGRPP